MDKAVDLIKAQYLTEVEVANLFGVVPERIRDLRSNHNTGKAEFIPVSSISSKEHLYHVEDVLEFIRKKRSGPFVSQTSSLEE
jgi:hypothetical protein